MQKIEKVVTETAIRTCVIAERLRQDEKWGVQNHNDEKWLVILTEEVGEVSKSLLDYDAPNEDELVQVIAVVVAWADNIRRVRGGFGEEVFIGHLIQESDNQDMGNESDYDFHARLISCLGKVATEIMCCDELFIDVFDIREIGGAAWIWLSDSLKRKDKKDG